MQEGFKTNARYVKTSLENRRRTGIIGESTGFVRRRERNIMKIQLIASDLDGTLLTDKKEFTKRTREVLT